MVGQPAARRRSSKTLTVDPQLLAAGGITTSQARGVLTVTLARPQVRNAQLPATWRALAAVGDSLDSDVRAVVLRAEGTSFSAGLDRRMFSEGVDGEPSLASLATLNDADFDAVIAGFQRAFAWLGECDAISIAAVAGHAVGAGFQLALACDLMVVADTAVFSMRETQLGLVPDLTGTWPLVRAAGYPRALEACISGRWISAEEALAWGLAVSRVSEAQLAGEVDRVIESFATAAPGAVRETKRLLRSATTATRYQQHGAERQAQRRRILELAAAFAGQ